MLQKIAVEELTPGMFLHELSGSWLHHPFWRTKFILASEDDIRLIIASGIKDAVIDTEKGLGVQQVLTETEPEPADIVDTKQPASIGRSAAQQRVSMQDELQRAAKICDSSKDAVKSMFQEVRMGKAISAEAAGEVVEEISSSVMRNPGTLISLARLKTADDYTYMHSVAVCALMIALSRQLDLDETQMRQAGLAGLLHDLGKAAMPMEVLNKPGKLTDEEFAIIKSHPVEGYRLLKEGMVVGEIPLDVCLHHHEKVDGSGYPDGLKGDQISLFAKMGAVCDVYDAITSNRPYKAGWEPSESIAKMTEWSKGHFDQVLFQSFVRCIGIYPVGSLVRVSSDRLGVVIEQSEKSLLTPVVKLFFSIPEQTYIPTEVLDLSLNGHREKIVGREDAEKWGIANLNQWWTA